MILEYVLKYHLQDCIDILSEEDNLGYFSIKIDFLKLFETYPDVGDKVLCSPIESLPSCNRDIIKAQQNILELDEHKQLVSKLKYYYLKRNVHARFFGLPVCPELHRTVFPKNVDLGCFLKVTGTIVRVTQSKMLEYQRKYVCVKCKYENSVEAEFENRYILKAPSKCGNTESRCKSSTFTQVNLVSREHCKDYQEIKIQEQVNKLSIGSIPGSMWVVLEDDLVDCCKPGDDVNICGTVRRRWRPCSLSKKSEVELVVQANHVEVSNAQRCEVIASAPDVKDCFDDYWDKYQQRPLRGRDQILTAVCPQVYGLHLVKLAVLLTVITGSDHVLERDDKKCAADKHASRVRGQCHLLLIGDPGTGKSQLLKASAELSARSVLTSGAGSTRAGLTCAALREDGEWQLEAGALVLSDGGVCAIDEVGLLRDHDRAAIHEAMEQQTISVAKAGIVCKLNTRCAVVAACNPRGRYHTDQPTAANVALGTPLLSRFDLIFILLDSKNAVWDKLVSSYILFGDSSASDSKKQWTTEKLQTYISLVGPRSATMSASANRILRAYYMAQRGATLRDPSRTTVRMLDSLDEPYGSCELTTWLSVVLLYATPRGPLCGCWLDSVVRLSQAHCRLMYRTTILPTDAITAVSLVDLSMQDPALSDTADALHSTFHKYPDLDYLCLAKKLLTRLNLHDLWQQELMYYGKILQVDHKTLEANVEKGNPSLFAKYDDISDENIHLSASLVTSSYFKKKVQDNEELNLFNDKENFKNKDSNEQSAAGVSEKLAATLKKHATLNKTDKKPPVVQKMKRKRKEVVIDTGTKKKLKISNKKEKNANINNDNITDSDDDNDVTNNMLNAVPSVNDFFAELGIDLKFDTEQDVIQGTNEKNEFGAKHSTQKDVTVKENHLQHKKEFEIQQSKQNGNSTNTNHNRKIKEEPNKSIDDKNESINKSSNKSTESVSSKTVSKLKQFQFVPNHDLSKYQENVEKPKLENNSPVKLANVKDNSNNSSMTKKSSVQSSQISIFESSDCDIDLDI